MNVLKYIYKYIQKMMSFLSRLSNEQIMTVCKTHLDLYYGIQARYHQLKHDQVKEQQDINLKIKTLENMCKTRFN